MRSAASRATAAAVAAMVAAAGGAAGCATTIYHPVDAVRAADDPRPPATAYGIVGKNGKGQLHVFSLGGKKLPVGPSGASIYLHLRLAALNAGDDLPWVLDPNDQHLGLDGRMVPAAFSTTSQGRPVLWLTRGASGYLDLYYPLPDAGDPPRVTLAWRLRRGTAAAAQVTEFVRVSGRKMDEFAAVGRVGAGGPSEMYYHHYTGAHWGMGWWWPESCLWWHDWHGRHGVVAGRYYDDGQRWQQHPTPRTLERQRIIAEAASRSSQDWDRSDSSWTSGGSRSNGGGYGSSDTSHWRNPGGSSSYSSSSPSSSSSSSAESSGGGSSGGGSAPTFAPGDAAKSGWRGGGAN